MPLSSQSQNFISRAMDKSVALIALRSDLEQEVASWNLNDLYNQILDEDIKAVGSFSHLDKGKIIAYVNAIKSVLVALGSADQKTGDPIHDDISSQAANLTKMKG